jgi:hypothetical protein
MRANPRPDLVPSATKCEEFSDFALNCRRIVDRPMKVLFDGWQRGARFFRVVANRNDQIECLTGDFVDQLAAVPCDVDSKFGHRLNRKWVHEARRT